MQSGGQANARQTADQIAVGAERAATNLKSRITEISASSVEAMKEELARTGTVIREKAKAAGQTIMDSTANARTTAAVKARLLSEPGISSFSINVDCTDGLVTLSGKVD